MRIIVKNLPEKAKEEEIKKIFSKHGELTDLYFLKNNMGKFKRICYIGYLDEDTAMKAISHEDGTFIKNCKITCELAKESGETRVFDESIERVIKYSTKIFIKSIPSCMNEDKIRENLEKYGEIDEIKIIESKNGKNLVVKFKDGESAIEAYKNLHILGGKRVKVAQYIKKENNKKQEYYNTLFFNFESVVKRTCERENIDIKDLVNIKDKNLGSRIALMETHLVQQTKEFLENNGIFLDNLTGNFDKKRVILRNMDVMKCLDLVKEDCKISIAPSKCLALLKFSSEESAKACIKSLALRRVKDQVLYCEYAPESIIPEGREIKETNDIDNKKEDEISPLRTNGNKLLIKNLPFQASIDDVKSLFSTQVKVVDVRIPIKRDGHIKGFCFVTLSSALEVDKAIEYFGSSTHLFGRRLVLERAKS